jgi:NADPH2:quinone reductase
VAGRLALGEVQGVGERPDHVGQRDPTRAGAGAHWREYCGGGRRRKWGRGSIRARMRALQITELTGPVSALELSDVPEPGAEHFLTNSEGVVVEVRAAGVSFPELLQTRGMYQIKPPLPFVPGSEVAGIVRSAPDGAPVREGDRVAAFCMLGGFAEVAVAPDFMTFALPDSLDFAQGAGLILNYHTAYFALKLRGRLAEGETVLVHGAAGGVGTAAIQVAKGLGARVLAVVSSDEKERVAREAGADEVLRSDGPWKDEVKEAGGADVVIDPVGGDRFTDSIRSLREGGRVVVVGFTAGEIPEVRVNRLLLNNVEIVGAGWGAYVLGRPEVFREVGDAVLALGVQPIVGERFPLERGGEALTLLERRGALGKVVLELDGE